MQHQNSGALTLESTTNAIVTKAIESTWIKHFKSFNNSYKKLCLSKFGALNTLMKTLLERQICEEFPSKNYFSPVGSKFYLIKFHLWTSRFDLYDQEGDTQYYVLEFCLLAHKYVV